MGDVLNSEAQDGKFSAIPPWVAAVAAEQQAAEPPFKSVYMLDAGQTHRHSTNEPSGPGWRHHNHAGGGVPHSHDEAGFQVRPESSLPKLPDLQAMIRAFQVAMTDEEVPASVIRRVVNRVMYGDACGPSCVRAADSNVVVHVHTQAANAAELAREVHKLVLVAQRRNPGWAR